MSAEGLQKQPLPDRTSEMVKQIESVEQRVNAFIEEMKNKQDNLSELDKKRLEAASVIARELSLLKDQVMITGNARACYKQMESEVKSWKAGAKYASMKTFTTLLSLFLSEEEKKAPEQIMEGQFKAMVNAGTALLNTEFFLNEVISNIDKTADHLLEGNIEGFLESNQKYMKNMKNLLSNIDMMEFNVKEFESSRKNFEGAFKVVKDFFIDASTVVVGMAALGAVAKMGKVQKLMRLAKEEAEIGKYWYQTWAGVSSKIIPMTVDGTVAVIGNYLKEEGKLDVKDATLIMACAFIPYLGAKFHVPKEHMKVGKKVSEMLKQVKEGNINMKDVVDYVNKIKETIPEIKKFAERFAANETSGVNPEEIMKGLKKMYRKTTKVAKKVGSGVAKGAGNVVKSESVKKAKEVGKEVAIDISKHELRHKLKHGSNEAQNEQQESNKN